MTIFTGTMRCEQLLQLRGMQCLSPIFLNCLNQCQRDVRQLLTPMECTPNTRYIYIYRLVQIEQFYGVLSCYLQAVTSAVLTLFMPPPWYIQRMMRHSLLGMSPSQVITSRPSLRNDERRLQAGGLLDQTSHQNVFWIILKEPVMMKASSRFLDASLGFCHVDLLHIVSN